MSPVATLSEKCSTYLEESPKNLNSRKSVYSWCFEYNFQREPKKYIFARICEALRRYTKILSQFCMRFSWVIPGRIIRKLVSYFGTTSCSFSVYKVLTWRLWIWRESRQDTRITGVPSKTDATFDMIGYCDSTVATQTLPASPRSPFHFEPIIPSSLQSSVSSHTSPLYVEF